MKTLRVTISFAFILFCASCNTQPKTTLLLNLQKGDKFLYTSSTDSKTSSEIMGVKMDQHQQAKVSYAMEVTGRNDDSSMNINCVLTDISIKTDGADKKSQEDSMSQQAMMNKMMDAMKGISFEMTMSETGEVKSVKGADNTFDAILSSLPADMDTEKDQMKELMKQYTGEDALKESFKSFRFYPDHPVAVGDEWKNNFKMEMLALQMNNTFTLRDVNSNNATISVTGKMINDSTAEPMEMRSVKMKYDLTGDQSGTMTVNTINGLLKETNLNQKISGKMEMSGGQLPSPVSLPMNIDNIITVKITKM